MNIPRTVLTLLGCVVVTTACSTSKLGTSNTPSFVQTTSKTPTAHDEVVTALKKWSTVRSFRQRFTSTSNGATSSGEMEFVAPDRVHFIMNIAGESFESITIGQAEYTKDLDGKWVKTTLESQPATSRQERLFADPRYVAELAKNVTDVKLVTTENNGTPLRVYKFKHMLPDTEGTYESQMWVSVTDGLPQKVETTYDFTVEGVKRSGKSSIVCSDYNTAIQIDQPI